MRNQTQQSSAALTDKGMRILLISPFPEDLTRVVGGVEAVALTLSQALSEHPKIAKVLVVSVVQGSTALRRVVVSPSLEIVYLAAPFMVADTILRSRQILPRLSAIARGFAPDVIHGQGLGRPGRLATGLAGPAVITIHGLVHVEQQMAAGNVIARLRARLLGESVRSVLQRADLIISTSSYDADLLNSVRVRSHVSIPNAVSNAFFNAVGGVATEGVVLFAGMIRRRKNIIGLVRAFAQVHSRLPLARLKIAGPIAEPDYYAEIISCVDELRLSGVVSFLGHVPEAELVAAMSDASAVALFSDEETLPTVIAQAMAVGRPVVSSDVGGVREMVRDGETGWIVPRGDVDALAGRLYQVLKDPGIAAEMGLRSADHARVHYTVASVTNQTVMAYQKAFETRGLRQAGRAGSKLCATGA